MLDVGYWERKKYGPLQIDIEYEVCEKIMDELIVFCKSKGLTVMQAREIFRYMQDYVQEQSFV